MAETTVGAEWAQQGHWPEQGAPGGRKGQPASVAETAVGAG